jgi:hypothetical protein
VTELIRQGNFWALFFDSQSVKNELIYQGQGKYIYGSSIKARCSSLILARPFSTCEPVGLSGQEQSKVKYFFLFFYRTTSKEEVWGARQ